MATPRGIRNNNPGNIRHGDPWKGLAPEQPDSAFCTFVSADYGFRAAAKIIVRYQAAYGAKTIRSIITRWAPPNENDTLAYVAAVAQSVGIGPDDPVEFAKAPELFRKLLKAICRHENGQCPYDDAVIDSGLRMAGIDAA